jgi:putative DNA primase/helicase
MYRIPQADLEPFYAANQLVIPISDPSDGSLSLDTRGKRPIKGLSFRRAEPSIRYPYESFHNAAWVVRDNVVVDIDPRDGGKEGYAKLCELVGVGLHTMAGSVTVTTGGGGKHIYLALPTDDEWGSHYQGVGQQHILLKRFEIPGIQIKSGNGFVVIPGSKHYSGGMYSWDSERTIADGLPLAPSEFYKMIEKDSEGVALTGGLSEASSSQHDLERARVLVAEYEGAGSGERNEQMYRLAVRLLDFGLDEHAAHEHLAAADNKNHPPIGQREIHDIYKKAARYRKNEFGALSIQADFEEVDTDVIMADGTRLSPEEARKQLSEVTGRDDALKAAQDLLDAWGAGDGDMDLFDDIVADRMGIIVRASDSVLRRIRRMLTEGGRSKVMGTADFDEYVRASQQTVSDDLPETIGMTILEGVYGGQKLRYTQGSFFTFNPNMWHKVDEKEVQNYILNECNRLRQENPELGFSNVSVSMNAINILKARTHIRPDNFFPHVDRMPPRVMNCTNGELWIDNAGGLELRDPDPGTRLFHSLKVAWNPDADCPRYKRALREVFQHCDDPDDVIRHYLEVKGYHLSPRKPLPVIEVGVGSGANGKTLLNTTVVAGIVGRDAVGTGPLSMFMKDTPSATARLENKLLWIDPDLDATKPLPTGLLKALSENVMLTVEPKYMDAYNIMSICSWALMANELPVSRDASKGLQRRMYVFEYAHDFDEAGDAEAELSDVLLDEAEGIFRLWIEGLVRLIQRGHQFEVPHELELLRDEWMSTQNIVGAFVGDRCEYGKGAEVSSADLYQAFVNYCVADGTPREDVMKRHTFTKRVGSIGRVKVDSRGGNKRVVVGLRLSSEWEGVGSDGGYEQPEQPEQPEQNETDLPDWLQ